MESTAIIPARHNDRFTAVFLWYVRRLLRKNFFAVRIASGTEQCLGGDESPAPSLIAMNHASWWDPLVGLFLHHAYLPHRRGYAPMDTDQLSKFAFFRKVGLFGVDPDHASSKGAMEAYLGAQFDSNPGAALWITPQGRFADPRGPIELRPGAAAIAARFPRCRAVVVAIEYAFWLDKRPEVFIRCAPAPMPADRSTPHCHRALTQAMMDNAAALARLVIARDPAAFTTLLGGGSTINPVYDAWLRVRGRSAAIDSARVAGGGPTPKARAAA